MDMNEFIGINLNGMAFDLSGIGAERMMPSQVTERGPRDKGNAYHIIG
jgi:hypothetical protein